MVSYLFPGWVNAGENGGSKLVKKTSFRGSMLVVIYKLVDGKNPYAVILGRRGGLKGGKARAAKLTPEQRTEIAKKAAAKRWGKKDT